MGGSKRGKMPFTNHYIITRLMLYLAIDFVGEAISHRHEAMSAGIAAISLMAYAVLSIIGAERPDEMERAEVRYCNVVSVGMTGFYCALFVLSKYINIMERIASLYGLRSGESLAIKVLGIIFLSKSIGMFMQEKLRIGHRREKESFLEYPEE